MNDFSSVAEMNIGAKGVCWNEAIRLKTCQPWTNSVTCSEYPQRSEQGARLPR